jgi:hypothetical protein
MQASEATLETSLRRQPPMQESSRPLKIWTDFANDGTITKKQNVFQKISQQLLSSKHTVTLGQLMHLALNLKQ